VLFRLPGPCRAPGQQYTSESNQEEGRSVSAPRGTWSAARGRVRVGRPDPAPGLLELPFSPAQPPLTRIRCAWAVRPGIERCSRVLACVHS
jgi:hypothetical protein